MNLSTVTVAYLAVYLGLGLLNIVALLRMRPRDWGRASLPGYLVLITCAVYVACEALSVSSAEMGQKRLFLNIEEVGSNLLPTAMFVFLLRYIGVDRRLSRLVTCVLAGEWLASSYVVLTNQMSSVYWSPTLPVVEGTGQMHRFDLNYGPLGLLQIGCLIAVGIACLPLVTRLARPPFRAHRAEISLLSGMIVLTIIGCLCDSFGLLPWSTFSLTSPLASIGAIMMAFLLLPMRRGDRLAVSRELVMSRLPTGVVILNESGIVVDATARSLVLMERSSNQVIGKPLQDAWPDWQQSNIGLEQSAFVDIVRGEGDSRVVIAVRISPIVDFRGEQVSTALIMRNVTERRQLRAELSRRCEQATLQAETDSLTGLLNHGGIHKRLDYELKRAQREGSGLSFAMIDLDGFKLLNDTHGHPVGDKALREITEVLTNTTRQTDIVGRYGGDEFAIIMPATGTRAAVEASVRLQKALKKHVFVPREGYPSIPLGMSVGIASYPDDAKLLHELVGCADTNLYESKHRGGNTVTSRERFTEEGIDVGNFALLESLITAVDNKDHYTRQHSEAVAEYSLLLAEEIGISSEIQDVVRIAGLLHDLGKIGVPDKILRKPGPLNEMERSVIQQHTVLGQLIIKEVPNLPDVLSAVAAHHERFDGTGYPHGLRGEEIPFLGRILAVADAYAAMIADRPYRKALSHEQAREELLRISGSQLDPQLVQSFIHAIENKKEKGTATEVVMAELEIDGQEPPMGPALQSIA